MFLIGSYDTPLTQELCIWHSGPGSTLNYDYIVTNSINSLLIGSSHTNYC